MAEQQALEHENDIPEDEAEPRAVERDIDDEIVEDDPAPVLDPEAAARRAAALAQIRKFGDPVLRTRARPV
ncbi:MAG: hypothetical protein QOJ25_89, partial [Solirubrobacteraceae bacterium]|nr:hypothetical protein [Solirubrobacteraceae bacterium]